MGEDKNFKNGRILNFVRSCNLDIRSSHMAHRRALIDLHLQTKFHLNQTNIYKLILDGRTDGRYTGRPRNMLHMCSALQIQLPVCMHATH